MPSIPSNQSNIELESPKLDSPIRLPSTPKAICREHSSWRGRIRAALPFDGPTIRCIRIARFTLILGPWRSLTNRILRHLHRKRVFPRISPTLFPCLDVDAASKALHEDGFALGLQLPSSLIKEITDFALQSELVEESHWDCPAIHRIAHDCAIVEVVKRYLGTDPILYGTTLFWTLPNDADTVGYPEMFHYDVADFKSVCVCFYLTDVGLASAPHVAIAGTHKKKSIARLLNPFLTDEVASQRFGSRINTFIGRAGMGFFEDQATQHKRLVCMKPRLALFVNYTLHRNPDTIRRNIKQPSNEEPLLPSTPSGTLAPYDRRRISLTRDCFENVVYETRSV